METPTLKKNDPWMIDDSHPYDPEIAASIKLSPELQAKLDAIFDEDSQPKPAKVA